MAKTKTVPPEIRDAAAAAMPWHQVSETVFRLGAGPSGYWKTLDGWWASRKGQERFEGPFKTPEEARSWAEEPRRARREAHLMRAAATAAIRSRETWAGLPPGAQELRAGQVWQRRHARFKNHEVLLVSKAAGGKWRVRTRVKPRRTWSKKTVVRSVGAFTTRYRLVDPGE